MEEVLNFKLGYDTFRCSHHNMKVELQGIIKMVNTVTPKLINATFKCDYCGKIISQPQGGGRCKLLKPETCSNQSCNSKRPKFTFILEKSEFKDYQEIWLKPIEESKIRLGRGQKVILENKLVDVKEGQNVMVVGRLGFELKGRTTFARPVVIATKLKQLD